MDTFITYICNWPTSLRSICFCTVFDSRWFFWLINIWLDYFNYLSLFLYIFAIFIQFGCVSMSVYAKGLLEKARREIETNYKETGFRETNFERHKREEKEHGR